MTYKYFFFDFDGMLADSYPHTTTAFIKTLEKTRNVKINYKEAYDHFKVSFYDAYDFYKVTKEEDEMFDKLHSNIDFKPEITLYLPVKHLLNTIIKSGGKNFIYTNRSVETLYPLLKKLGIYDLFEDIIPSADKPDPKSLNDMIEKHNLDKKDCVVVGDRSIDVDGAYNAGVDGILYDVDSRVFIHHGKYVIKKINQLYDFIDVKMLKHNYHTHTIRCGHATGSDEEYVIEAIKNGYQTLGFSDHLMIPDVSKNFEYFESICLLKEKYKDQIDIKIALEVEDFPYYYNFYDSLLKEGHCDYLVFGNHAHLDADKKDRIDSIPYMTSDKKGDTAMLDMYYESLKRAVESGLFKYIAHPDVFLRGYLMWDDNTIFLAHKIARLLKEHDMYAEINAQGIRSGEYIMLDGIRYPAYPFEEFFKILKEYDIKFVIGADAHQPLSLSDEAVERCFEFADRLGLNVVDEIEGF